MDSGSRKRVGTRDDEAVTDGIVDVAVVEDLPATLEGIVAVIGSDTGLRVLATSRSVEEYLASGVEPHVVVLDLSLPGVVGATAVPRVCDGSAAVLVVSASDAPEDVLDCLAAGASGYIVKGADPGEICRAIRVVAGGGAHVSPALAACLLAEGNQAGPAAGVLTEREREVLTLVAAGETDRDIAGMLSISVSTVRSHLDRIRVKTGRRRRADLTRLAFELGLLPPDEGGDGPRT